MNVYMAEAERSVREDREINERTQTIVCTAVESTPSMG